MVLGGFWETKIVDFHTFFDVFSMPHLQCILEGPKSNKKSNLEAKKPAVGLGSAARREPVGGVGEGTIYYLICHNVENSI